MKRHRPKIVGVYKIRNRVNGKCYVGSAVDMESRCVAADPAERKRRSDRAVRQHAEGAFGRITWSTKAEKSFSNKMKQRAPRDVAIGLIAHWKKPESRRVQSEKLSEFASANPQEMSRRASSYWDALTPEERKAHGVRVAASPGRSALIGKTVAETWKDPAVRARRIAGLRAAALRRKMLTKA